MKLSIHKRTAKTNPGEQDAAKKKRNRFLVLSIPVAAVLVIVAIVYVVVTAPGNQADNFTKVQPITSSDHIVGSPNAPVKLAGMRIDPPPSLEVTSGSMHEASAAAEPPLEPPGVHCRFQGFRVTP